MVDGNRLDGRVEEADLKMVRFHADRLPRRPPRFNHGVQAFGPHAGITLRHLLMAFKMRPTTDALRADEDEEDEGEDEEAQKNVYDSASDSADEEQENGKVIEDQAEQDDHDNDVDTDVSHADTVQPEERDTEVGHTRDKGGENKQRDSDDDSEGDGLEHDKLNGNVSEENVSEADEFEHEYREGDEHEVVDNINEGGHKNDEKDVETGHDADVEMVDVAQAVPVADPNKTPAAVNAERHLSELEYVEIFIM